MKIVVTLDLCQDNGIFFIFSYKKIWRFQKIVVPLHQKSKQNGF